MAEVRQREETKQNRKFMVELLKTATQLRQDPERPVHQPPPVDPAVKRAVKMVEGFNSLVSGEDVSKLVEDLEQLLEHAQIPRNEWKHHLHQKLTAQLRESLSDRWTDPGVDYDTYREELLKIAGYIWQSDALKWHSARVPKKWRQLLVGDLLSATHRCLARLFPMADEETEGLMIKYWI